MKKTYPIILVPTDDATGLFIKTQNWRGDKIYLVEKKLEFSNNETFINNIHLISSGKAATNAQDKYDFFKLCVLGDNLEDGDTVYNSVLQSIDDEKYSSTWCEDAKRDSLKISVSTDPDLKLPQLPEAFIQAYVKAYNEGDPITEVTLKVEDYWVKVAFSLDVAYRPEVRPDNTVIVHQSRVYSRKETQKKCLDFFEAFSKKYAENGTIDPLEVVKWADENL